ncbi:MAG: (d)CMP kinase [Planctomycetota bacterium]|nr:MAG: (d)CMP kinase [Planctomycetota bacterium]
MIIAMDGPSGSGKSTVAREVARRLGALHIDSGAIYRALTLAALERGLPLDDPARLAALAREVRLELEPTETGELRVRLDGCDVTDRIRSPEVTRAVSRLAAVAPVRAQVTERVRRIAAVARDAVADGRDTTTVIFPHADLKVYLEASAEERARRRARELARRGRPEPYEQVLRAIEERDRQDRERAVAPLRIAPDALVIDTTNMTIDEVVDTIVQAARERGATGGRRPVASAEPVEER